jgi:putative ABC transport system permease protein
MEKLAQDIRYALRIMLKRPMVSVMAILALALGIGANTAVFSVVNTVLLSSLPYEDPNSVVMVWGRNVQEDRLTISFTPGEFKDYREQNQVLTGLAGVEPSRFNLIGDAEPTQISGARASANYFSLLGVRALIGRTFSSDEDQPGKSQVIILSYALWQRRFGSDPGIIGRQLKLYLSPAINPNVPPSSDPSGDIYEVIGVLPSDFRMPQIPSEVWVPLVIDSERLDRVQNSIRAIGRLKPGVTPKQAEAQMNSIASQLAEQYPETNKDQTVFVNSIREQEIGDIRQTLLTLLVGVGLVLLIACANVANLLLTRASEREKEIALRMAVGASRSRLFRQLLTESILLSLIGGALGLFLAYWGTKVLVSISPGSIPRIEEVTIDGVVLAVTFGISVVTGIIFGLAPAIQFSKPDLNQTLKEATRSLAGSQRRRGIGNLLVISEISLALMLLIGAGLIAKSFTQLRAVDLGFNPKNVLTVPISLSYSKYSEGPQQAEFFRQALEKVRLLPGVQSAGAINILPITPTDQFTPVVAQGQPEPGPGETPNITVRTVSPDFFSSMGIPILSGEDFREENFQRFRFIINETFARRYFPNEEPVGKRLAMGPPDARSPFIPIIGVVKDVRQFVETEGAPTVYIPYIRQISMTLAIRTTSDPVAMAAGVRNELSAIDKDQPIDRIVTMEKFLTEGDTLSQARFRTILLVAFGATALMLAAIGLYGVISYSVTQRTHEIGLRMALGAQRTDLFKLVIGQGLVLTLIGIVIGLMAAFALTRVIAALLYGVSATDPIIFTATPLFLLLVAILASVVPARSATKVDPMVALRYE